MLSSVRLPSPQASEEVSIALPSGGALPCRVRSYTGPLVLDSDPNPNLLRGDRAVLRRVWDGQTYLFPETILKASPLTLTYSCPEVVREPRVRACVSLVYAVSGGPPQKTRMVDLSSGGLCFHAWPPLPDVGTELDLEFDLYPVGQVRARGAIVRVYGRTNRWPEVGVRFLHVCPQGAWAIAAWLRVASAGRFA